jgi:hypothetical protein
MPKQNYRNYFNLLKVTYQNTMLKTLVRNNFLCKVNYKDMVFDSTGTSKRIAETNVAMKLLAYIKQNNV